MTTTRCDGFGDHAEIVADQDDRRAEIALQLPQQPQDLRLDRDIERGRRLVGDQDLRAAGKRHRDHDALAHAAGELMRVLVRGAAAHRECGRGRSISAARSRRRACSSP